jgi:flagellin
MISGVDAALQSMTDAAATLGSSKSRIDMQTDFVGNLMDAIDRGIGQLVDADMSQESTRLQALQVQQQLGVQSLSIANSNAQSILSLFR